MRARQFLRTSTLALVVALGIAPVAAGADPAPPAAADEDAATASSATVTLITGDVVRLDTDGAGNQQATVVKRVDPRAGYHTYTSGGDVYVEPGATTALLAGQRLDPQLFNISSLVRQGYDDATRSTLPLIVEYSSAGARGPGLAAIAAPDGSHKDLVLESIDALSVTAAKSDAEAFWRDIAGAGRGGSGQRSGLRDDFSKVWLDFRVEAILDRSTAQIRAPEAWASGLEGQGVKVAVLDTGIDATHPDFAGRVGSTRDFSGTGTVADRAGHGTHVASIVAGSGAASNGAYRGVAPGSTLMVGKVLNDDAAGAASWAIEGMEWAATNDADIVNMSLGGPVTKGDDPMSQALDALTEEYGTLFVVAAGNGNISIPGTMDVTTPGAAADALTVGAVSRTNSPWSGSRNGLMGDAYLKPEIMAPGMGITAARAAGTGSGSTPYVSMTGSSMASPHVAGSAALVLQRHPGWSPAQLKAGLTSTAAPITAGSSFSRGAGVVDVARATRQGVYVDRGVAFMGYFARPFVDGHLESHQKLTYTNDTDQPVLLDLTTTLTDRYGDPVPDGILTVSPASLTIPAGGEASATASVDVSDAEATEYSGRVMATAGGGSGVEVDATVGFLKQNDMVDVTFRAIDAHGDPGIARVRVAPYLTNDGRYYPDNVYLTPEQNEWTLRLPEGEYNVFGLITTKDASGRFEEESSIVHDPKLSVAAPNFTVTLDARTARPVSADTPRRSTPRELTMSLHRGEPGTTHSTSDEWYWNYTDGEPSVVSVAGTEHVDDAPFELLSQWETGVPLLTTEVTGRGHQKVDAVYEGGPQIDGDLSLRAVDAGHATASDLRGLHLRDSVALVQETNDISWEEQVQAAADAGAEVVLLYSAEDGVFYPQVGGPVPVVSVDRKQGLSLRSAAKSHGTTRIRFHGTPRTPYAYALTFVEKQGVENRLDYRVRDRDLAKVTTRFHTTGTGEHGWRLHYGSYAACACSTPTATDYVPSLGYTRTEYVTADPEIATYGAWQFLYNFPGDLLFARDRNVFRPRQGVTENWLQAPLSPGVANNTATPYGWRMLNERTATGQLRFDLAGVTDSGGNWMRALSGSQDALRVYRAGELILSRTGSLAGDISVPPEQATYRLEADTDHDGTVLGLSTRTRSVWTFGSSATGAQQVLPLVDVDYPDLTRGRRGSSALDLANTAERGEDVTLHLTGSHQNGAQAGDVTTMKVWVSYDDGETWAATSVRRGGDEEFTASYRHPRRGDFVSLRAAASDGAGNALEQTLIHAYRLG